MTYTVKKALEHMRNGFAGAFVLMPEVEGTRPHRDAILSDMRMIREDAKRVSADWRNAAKEVNARVDQ